MLTVVAQKKSIDERAVGRPPVLLIDEEAEAAVIAVRQQATDNAG